MHIDDEMNIKLQTQSTLILELLDGELTSIDCVGELKPGMEVKLEAFSYLNIPTGIIYSGTICKLFKSTNTYFAIIACNEWQRKLICIGENYEGIRSIITESNSTIIE